MTKVKTAKSELIRPAKKLISLEIRQDEKFEIIIELLFEPNKVHESSMPKELLQSQNTSTTELIHTRSGRLVEPVERFGQI